MTDQETEQLFGHFGIILPIAQDHVVAEAACVRFDAEREFGIERIGHLGNDQADDVGFVADQTACECIDTVALPSADFQDPLAGLLAQFRRIAECAGDGRSRNTGNACDIFDGNVLSNRCRFLTIVDLIRL